YQRQNVERRSAEADQTLTFLKQQLPEIKQRLEVAEAALNGFRLRQGSADLSKETELILQQSVDFETKRFELVQKREEATRRFTTNHPVVQAVDAQLRQIEREQATVNARVKGLPDTQQELLGLARDVEVNTALYTSLLNSSQELQVAKAGTVGNVRIVDYAVRPLGPAKPNRRSVLGLSVVLGILIGVGIVLIRRAMHQGVEDASEVERVLGLPTYASIPFSDEQRKIIRAIKKEGSGSGQILAAVDSGNLAVEALRSLRTSLHFALLEAPNNIVMLTGPSPGLGKSFVSINLGAVLAMSRKRVVVVDADLRRGHLHDYVSGKREPGVSDYVAGDVDYDSLLQTTSVDGLCCIPTGTVPPNPAELLLHERFTELLKRLSAEFDYVLVDTPPVLAVTDAAVIGRLAGCTLLVLKAGEHPMRAIDETARQLRQAGVALRGTIFNQVGMRGGKYGYGYGYGYGYSYGYKYGHQYSYKSQGK
ncbi:MAG TPA: polysaccharide biosynthesis tyrosine autokinase, partial [Solimonas sp.]